MPNKSITQFNNNTNPSGENIFPIVVSGITMKQSLSGLTDFFNFSDTYITGGTYSSGTTILTNNTGGTISISGYSTGSTVGLQEVTNVGKETTNGIGVQSLIMSGSDVYRNLVNDEIGLTTYRYNGSRIGQPFSFGFANFNSCEFFLNENESAIINVPSTGAGRKTLAYVEDVRPYKVYTALLTQTGTAAPVATVLENTLGVNIIWIRSGIGAYRAVLLESLVAQEKTTLLFNNHASYQNVMVAYRDGNYIQVETSYQYTGNDNVLYFDTIEIRVYN